MKKTILTAVLLSFMAGVLPAQAAQPLPQQVSYVKELYKTVLRRTPSQSEVDYWSNVYRNAPLTCYEITRVFLLSVESRQLQNSLVTADLVVYLYRAAFNRTPDLAGAKFWLSSLGKGVSRSQLVSIFASSPEVGQRCIARGLLP
ncbi:MAG: DUF4214 domain-containing protein [Bdellovibrionales bacterium]|nr:DUF4214 domain-containing protein [Bdellovibrionales bacterium]